MADDAGRRAPHAGHEGLPLPTAGVLVSVVGVPVGVEIAEEVEGGRGYGGKYQGVGGVSLDWGCDILALRSYFMGWSPCVWCGLGHSRIGQVHLSRYCCNLCT